MHTTRHLDRQRAADQAIANPLVISFGVVVLDLLRDGAAEVPLPDRNQAVQAFFSTDLDEACGEYVELQDCE